MESKLIIKKCEECNKIVKVIEKSNQEDLICCGKKMKLLIPNEQDASFEKHVPTYEIKNNKILVKVNHVMNSDHYIKWIAQVSDKGEKTVYLTENEEAQAEFDYIKDSVLYSYCNLHGLWKQNVK